MTGTLKEQLDAIMPALREMQLRKEERVNQIRAVQMQIHKISSEIAGNAELEISPMDVNVDENDLSLKKLDEYRVELQQLHREKSNRLMKVEEYIRTVHSLSATLGMDSSEIITNVHPSLDSSSMQQAKNISDAILARLNSTVESLKEEKQKRLEKDYHLQITCTKNDLKTFAHFSPQLDVVVTHRFWGDALATLAYFSLHPDSDAARHYWGNALATLAPFSLSEEGSNHFGSILHKLGKALENLWRLMDTSSEDRILFAHVTDFIALSAVDISKPGSLTLEIIQQAEAEVERLDQLKASKMKELFLKKQLELAEICKQTHMEIPSRSEMENIMNLINSGEIDHADLLASMDEQISVAKEKACSRKEIMEKVEKWMASCDEELWLEEYSRDENRYLVSRGAHKNLKRAERARVTVNKIPALVDSLIAKTKNWEEERKKVFLYDEKVWKQMHCGASATHFPRKASQRRLR
ncbi:hypothetical protein ACLOJK_039863 [Asimina triloba]